jgi:hypothetical protein
VFILELVLARNIQAGTCDKKAGFGATTKKFDFVDVWHHKCLLGRDVEDTPFY